MERRAGRVRARLRGTRSAARVLSATGRTAWRFWGHERLCLLRSDRQLPAASQLIGNFRVLFDYFFPGVIPGTPIDIPPHVITNWNTVYVPAITGVLAANPGRALELMRVAHAAFDPSNPATVINTAINVLWYNVFGGPVRPQSCAASPRTRTAAPGEARPVCPWPIRAVCREPLRALQFHRSGVARQLRGGNTLAVNRQTADASAADRDWRKRTKR
jgi:hypothetical protein